MPREVLEFRVVVASPSDVFVTRKAVFEAIYELNRIFEAQKISLRGMGWEEYVTPGIGLNAQDVINEQLLREYDILIAIFGAKLGTPTSTALSGTVEEIQHAISNTDSPLGQYRVQVYFLDKIDSASSISFEELKKVSDFRKELEPQGILYRLFTSDDELQQEVRVNIQRSILEYLHKNPDHRSLSSSHEIPKTEGSFEKPPPVETIGQDEGEVGILDIQERAEESLQIATIAVNRVNEIILELGAGFTSQVEQIEKLSFANSSAKDKKRHIDEFALVMEKHAKNLRQEASIAREGFNDYCQAVIAIASIQRQGSNDQKYQNDIRALLTSVEAILQVLPESRASLEGFKTAVHVLPRITSQFNRSKKVLLDALEECTRLFDHTERSIYEITAQL